ncbi:pre-mRNA-splicing factor CWC25 homolog [Xenia sp. Carnegie-2017]|uniref:pre-mRNA-splicing factor CWC25 homolog n=1 Tax=Xenia sp. Carnegie-2017 TaxID=2897299 RepID=UPI001F041ACC|nr:pre-mRNA-splicing factor CWC25 homolog [Xenia sp. Carnegie-2017]
MGGGDLNLKKSWHPQTLQNIEKVWKAEQKAEAEAKKIEQLRRELDEERQREEMQRYAVDQGIVKKKSDRLEWMYSAPGHAGINHEEYLLGKSIDKAVDPLAQNDEMNADAPGASFMDADNANAGNDLAAKIRDDPLFMIRKKENEKKKELLKNPVRMKQLQQMLKSDLAKKSKKSKKDKKKKKKKNSSSDEENRRYQHQQKHSSKRKQKSSLSGEEAEERHNGFLKRAERTIRRDDEWKRNGHNHQDFDKGHEHKENIKKNSKRSNSEERRQRYERQTSEDLRRYSNEKMDISDRHRKRNLLSPKRQHLRRSSSRDRSRSPVKKRHIEEKDEKREEREKFHQRRRNRNRQKSSSPNHHHRVPSNVEEKRKFRAHEPSKLTDKERERRLAQMMDNAKWRDEQRGKNVKRYKEEDEAEAKQTALNTEKGASFVQPLKVETYTSASASVENRIKRNINSLQRTPAAMENFLKK